MLWNKFDDDLTLKPEFQRLIDLTGQCEDFVLCRLYKFWRWASRLADQTGLLVKVGLSALVRIAGGDAAFWESVSEVGWLEVGEDGLRLPNFAKYFGGRSGATNRSSAAERQRRYRERKKAESDAQRNAQPVTSRSTEQELETEKEQALRSVCQADTVEADHKEQSQSVGGGESTQAPNSSKEAISKPKAIVRPWAVQGALEAQPDANTTPWAGDRCTKAGPSVHGVTPVTSDVTRVTPKPPTVTTPTPGVTRVTPQFAKPQLAGELNLQKVEIKAGCVFRRLNYHGQDGRIIWQAAGLAVAGLLSDHQLADAAEAVSRCSKPVAQPVGYFRQVLAEHVGGKEKLAELLKLVDPQLPSDWVGPPTDSILFRQARERRSQIKAELEPLKISIG